MLEIDVFNCARSYLAREGFTVIQLVPPGGQAPFSISFKIEGAQRTVFPDILAIRNGIIWVGEMKPKFDQADHEKLILLHTLAEQEIRSLCERVMKSDLSDHTANYVLCHSDSASLACPSIYQWIFQPGSQDPVELHPLA